MKRQPSRWRGVSAQTGKWAQEPTGCARAWLPLRRWPGQREALIGLLYVLGASIALLGARQDPHGRERMSELLAAHMLWARWPQFAVLLGCAVAVLLLGGRLARDRVFFPVFAAVASLTVPVLGLFLVFAALIAPALWQRAGASPTVGRLGAVAACGGGLAASWTFDAPSGACVALALSTFGSLSAVRGGAIPQPASSLARPGDKDT
jgi:zinc/manganese transport system permease protein